MPVVVVPLFLVEVVEEEAMEEEEEVVEGRRSWEAGVFVMLSKLLIAAVCVCIYVCRCV